MHVRIVDFAQVRVAALEHQGPPAQLDQTVERFIQWRMASGQSPVGERFLSERKKLFVRITPVFIAACPACKGTAQTNPDTALWFSGQINGATVLTSRACPRIVEPSSTFGPHHV